MLPAERSRAGISSRDVQLRHVCVKFVPLETSNAGKEVSAVQSLHAAVKLRSSLAVVENNIPSAVEGKEVREVQLSHVPSKLVPLERSRAGKET